VETLFPLCIEGDTLVYIAKLKNKGFIIISADFSAPPILGFCADGEYNPETMPPGLLYLIDKYQKSIRQLKEDAIEPTLENAIKWNEYIPNETLNLKSINSLTDVISIDPFIYNNWHQGYSYDRFCPDGCKPGCVAVAMAKVLHYWGYKITPQGSHTYNGHSANFGNENYCWSQMDLDNADNINSKLIYHAGISCETDYCAEGNQSGSNLDYARNGFVNYWGMSPDAEVRRRTWFSFSWKNNMIDELQNSRPIIYAGGGHSWIIAGYQSAWDGFWCNWGWQYFSVFCDGYYSLGEFTPYYNGGYVDLNDGEEAIFNLYPLDNFVVSSINGPSQLKSSETSEYSVNRANCSTATWRFSSNIMVVHGGDNWIALKAKSAGSGWIQCSYNLGGKIVTSPKKYVTCVQ
jgi:hypothetical protein